MSPSIKKTPQMVYRAGVGLVQVACCIIPVAPIVYGTVSGGNPSGSGSNTLNGGTPASSGALNVDGGKP